MNIKHLILSFLPTIVIASIIIYLSLIYTSAPTELTKIPYIDKYVHACMYLGLTFVFYFDMFRSPHLPNMSRSQKLWTIWLLPVICGGLMELGQKYLTTTRACELLDFVSNTIGATTGLLAGILIINPLLRKYRYKK